MTKLITNLNNPLQVVVHPDLLPEAQIVKQAVRLCPCPQGFPSAARLCLKKNN